MNIAETLVNIVTTRPRGKTRLVSDAVNHFGAANVTVAEVTKALNTLIFTKKLELSGDTRPMVSVPNSNRTDSAVALEKFIKSKGIVTEEKVKTHIRESFPEYTNRQVWASISGLLTSPEFARLYTARGFVLARADKVETIVTVEQPVKVMTERGAKIAATRAAQAAGTYVVPVKVMTERGAKIAATRAAIKAGTYVVPVKPPMSDKGAKIAATRAANKALALAVAA